jgi:hypothetical protein
MNGYRVADLAAALLVSGPAASMFVQAVKRFAPTRTTRLLLAIAVSVAVGTAQAWIASALPTGAAGITPQTILAASAAVLAGASAFYRMYFRRRAGRRPARQRRRRWRSHKRIQ